MAISEKIAKLFGGMDKVAHFGIGGMISTLTTLFIDILLSGLIVKFSWIILITPFIGTILVILLGIYKEKKLDPIVEWKDVITSIYCCACTHIVSILDWIILFII